MAGIIFLFLILVSFCEAKEVIIYASPSGTRISGNGTKTPNNCTVSSMPCNLYQAIEKSFELSYSTEVSSLRVIFKKGEYLLTNDTLIYEPEKNGLDFSFESETPSESNLVVFKDDGRHIGDPFFKFGSTQNLHFSVIGISFQGIRRTIFTTENILSPIFTISNCNFEVHLSEEDDPLFDIKNTKTEGDKFVEVQISSCQFTNSEITALSRYSSDEKVDYDLKYTIDSGSLFSDCTFYQQLFLLHNLRRVNLFIEDTQMVGNTFNAPLLFLEQLDCFTNLKGVTNRMVVLSNLTLYSNTLDSNFFSVLAVYPTPDCGALNNVFILNSHFDDNKIKDNIFDFQFRGVGKYNVRFEYTYITSTTGSGNILFLNSTRCVDTESCTLQFLEGEYRYNVLKSSSSSGGLFRVAVNSIEKEEIHGNVTVKRTEFIGNQMTAESGGVFHILNVNMVLEGDAFFNQNSVIGGSGGCIYQRFEFSCVPVCGISSKGTTFMGNSATKSGGAMYLENVVNVDLGGGDNHFSSNTAGEDGGGLYASFQDVDCLFVAKAAQFRNNSALSGYGGGMFIGINSHQSILWEDLSEFSINKAIVAGGGIYCSKIGCKNDENVRMTSNYSPNGPDVLSFPKTFGVDHYAYGTCKKTTNDVGYNCEIFDLYFSDVFGTLITSPTYEEMKIEFSVFSGRVNSSMYTTSTNKPITVFFGDCKECWNSGVQPMKITFGGVSKNIHVTFPGGKVTPTTTDDGNPKDNNKDVYIAIGIGCGAIFLCCLVVVVVLIVVVVLATAVVLVGQVATGGSGKKSKKYMKISGEMF